MRLPGEIERPVLQKKQAKLLISRFLILVLYLQNSLINKRICLIMSAADSRAPCSEVPGKSLVRCGT